MQIFPQEEAIQIDLDQVSEKEEDLTARITEGVVAIRTMVVEVVESIAIVGATASTRAKMAAEEVVHSQQVVAIVGIVASNLGEDADHTVANKVTSIEVEAAIKEEGLNRSVDNNFRQELLVVKVVATS